MSTHAVHLTPQPSVSGSRFASNRNRFDSALLGNLTILASTSTGEVADPTRMPAAARTARITLLRSRSVHNA